MLLFNFNLNFPKIFIQHKIYVCFDTTKKKLKIETTLRGERWTKKGFIIIIINRIVGCNIYNWADYTELIKHLLI